MASYSKPLVSCSSSMMMNGYCQVNMKIIECLYGTFSCFYSFLKISIKYLIHQTLNQYSLHQLNLLLSLHYCILLPFLSTVLLNFYFHLKATNSYFSSLNYVYLFLKILFLKYMDFKSRIIYFYTFQVHSIYEQYFPYLHNYHSQ